MDMQPAPEPVDPQLTLPLDRAMTRRGLLRAGALTGGGLVAATIAACAPSAASSGWIYGTTTNAPATPAASGAVPPSASVAPSHEASHEPSPSASAAPSASPPPVDHDAMAKAAVDRFLGGEATQVEGYGNQPLEPRVEDGVKVFELTVEEMDHRIDATKDPVKALGFNGTWPGPRLTVTEGDRVRAIFKNNMRESTGIHFHGQRLPNAMDGVPHVTQEPIEPGASFTYEFVARTPGSHMYHSHHNATDQVGRGLLGAFIVEPKDRGAALRPPVRRDAGHHLDQQRRARRVHDQRPRLPGDGADRGHPRRDHRHPVHERGQHDAPVAPPRDADEGRRARRLPPRVGGVHL